MVFDDHGLPFLKRPVPRFLLAALLLAAFYFSTQFHTFQIIDNDGHFHIRYSNLILERGIPERLPELKYTIWNQSYRDHHLLFHLLYIPFSLIPDIQTGAKAAAATFAVFAGMIFFLALVRLRARFPFLWLTLFAAGSLIFLYRIQMPRVQSLSLALLLVAVIALIERRPLLLFLVGAINVYLYDSFVLLPVAGLAWSFCNYLIEGRWDIKAPACLILGIAAATIINPFFPDNYASYLFSFQRSLAPHGTIPLPAEWQPDLGWNTLRDNLPIILTAVIVAMAAKLSARDAPPQNPQARTEHLFLMLLTLVFVALTLHARRFIEYSAAIAILFIAVSHRDLSESVPRRWRVASTVALLSCALLGGAFITQQFLDDTRTDDWYQCYLEAGRWFNGNAGPGDTIFTSDWDDFPILYMNAPHTSYVVGMDPLFLQRYDRNLYDLYVRLTQGRAENGYSDSIRNVFGSRYVFTDMNHSRFINRLAPEPGVQMVFSGNGCRIYDIGN